MKATHRNESLGDGLNQASVSSCLIERHVVYCRQIGDEHAARAQRVHKNKTKNNKLITIQYSCRKGFLILIFFPPFLCLFFPPSWTNHSQTGNLQTDLFGDLAWAHGGWKPSRCSYEKQSLLGGEEELQRWSQTRAAYVANELGSGKLPETSLAPSPLIYSTTAFPLPGRGSAANVARMNPAASCGLFFACSQGGFQNEFVHCWFCLQQPWAAPCRFVGMAGGSSAPKNICSPSNAAPDPAALPSRVNAPRRDVAGKWGVNLRIYSINGLVSS